LQLCEGKQFIGDGPVAPLPGSTMFGRVCQALVVPASAAARLSKNGAPDKDKMVGERDAFSDNRGKYPSGFGGK